MTGRRKRREGVVVSDKMDKTVVVVVARLARHSKYQKFLNQRARYKAHDEKGQYKPGDEVEIQEHRPISRDKRFIVTRLLKKFVEE